MIQNVLRNLSGIEVFGIVSIILFFVCFLGAVIWTFSRRKSYLESMRNLPLEKDPPETTSASTPPPPKP